ncbi:MAG TPA: carboxymuconolactone decarboxylase family protein [bacterium]|nr:carboxymuconolactone decarboxylase family protein [bacterium]
MKELLNNLKLTINELSKKNPEGLKKFNEFMECVLKNGSLDTKTKELIAIGIAVALRCPYCIGGHTEKALKAGATEDEIYEAGMVAVLMAGGPALTYITELKKAIELFKK